MNKIGKYFIVVGILLIIVAGFILIRNNYEEYEAGKKSADVVSVIKNNFGDNNQSVVTENIVNNEEVEEMASTTIDDYDYIGLIAIPSLNLELPVMSEYDNDRLRVAPVRYYGSVYTNDLIICAHSYKTHFGYLNKLQQKDIIIFTDINGESYVYEVLEIEVLSSDDITEMIDNDFDLTLYTCTSDGNSRITVRCNKLDTNTNI